MQNILARYIVLFSGRIVAGRTLFKEFKVMPKWQSPKVKSSICNIPISERDSDCNLLPRLADSNGVIIVRLKRKVEHRGHIICEPLRPTIIESVLNYLRLNNNLYWDIEINMENSPKESLNLQEEKFLEENSCNYKIRNIKQPINFVIANSVIDEEHDQNKTSVSSIASGERNDNCMTQYSVILIFDERSRNLENLQT